MLICSACRATNTPGTAMCQACGSSLPQHGSKAGTRLLPTNVAHALPPGVLLQNEAFRIDSVLGQGGFGITYRGTDLRLGREVAIKEFFPFGNAIRIAQDNRLEPSGGLSRGEFNTAREAFFDEARTLARFSHAHIVNVFSVFEEQNTAYMVMEFLAGESLQGRIDARHILGEDEALHVIEQIGPALEVVHDAGLLHRDLKPDNILLCSDTYNGERAVLLDFGSARAFKAGDTQNSDRLLTPGYAPLEQYSSSATFDVHTDLYALGATLYQCLTGRIPPAATDRAAGVELQPPHELNPRLNRLVSEAVLWALALHAADRPQSVREFLTALRSTKDSSHAVPAIPRTDPRAARIEALVRQIADGPAQRSTPFDEPLRELEEQFARIAAFRVPSEENCPGCGQETLKHIGPAIGVADCPLCEGRLEHLHIQEDRCPICREGALKEYAFAPEKLFCPLCHVAPLREEKRKKLGLLADTWLCCPHCKAEWETAANHAARLKVAGNQSAGANYLEQTKSIADWKEMAGRADRICRCDRCTAQFDLPGEGRMTLVLAPGDPHGVAARYKGKTFFRRAWARLAHGLALDAGDGVCRQCRAQWSVDRKNRTLQLLQCDERFSRLKGQTHGLSEWKYLRAGKRSGHAGYLCHHCTTEFDEENDSLRLVNTASDKLKGRNGQKFSLTDWHRLTAGLFDSATEAAQRQQWQRLKLQRDREAMTWIAAQKREIENLESELNGLARQSFFEGYLPAVDTTSMCTSTGEPIRWLSSCVLLQQRFGPNGAYWDTTCEGALMITASRLVFMNAPGAEYLAQPIEAIQRITVPSLGGQPLLEVQFQGLAPVGLLAAEMAIGVVVGGQVRSLTFSVAELAGWLNSQSVLGR